MAIANLVETTCLMLGEIATLWPLEGGGIKE